MTVSETLKKEWFVLILLLIPFVVSWYFWDQLPEQVPTHFNIKGEADDWGPKWVNAIMLPFISLGVYFLLIILPKIDPKKRIESTQKPIAAIRVFTSVFMVAIYGFVMAVSLGAEINFGNYIIVGVGALIMLLGNYMNSVKPNYFIGMRTPWTLENEEVWKKTHRLSSKIWIIGGLIMMLSPFFLSQVLVQYLTMVLVVFLAGIPFGYSYFIFKKIESNS